MSEISSHGAELGGEVLGGGRALLPANLEHRQLAPGGARGDEVLELLRGRHLQHARLPVAVGVRSVRAIRAAGGGRSQQQRRQVQAAASVSTRRRRSRRVSRRRPSPRREGEERRPHGGGGYRRTSHRSSFSSSCACCY